MKSELSHEGQSWPRNEAGEDIAAAVCPGVVLHAGGQRWPLTQGTTTSFCAVGTGM